MTSRPSGLDPRRPGPVAQEAIDTLSGKAFLPAPGAGLRFLRRGNSSVMPRRSAPRAFTSLHSSTLIVRPAATRLEMTRAIRVVGPAERQMMHVLTRVVRPLDEAERGQTECWLGAGNDPRSFPRNDSTEQAIDRWRQLRRLFYILRRTRFQAPQGAGEQARRDRKGEQQGVEIAGLQDREARRHQVNQAG